MGFIPMNFCFRNRTIFKPDGRKALELPPVTLAKLLLQHSESTDAVATCDRFGIANRADDLERLRRHAGQNLSRLDSGRQAMQCGTIDGMRDDPPLLIEQAEQVAMLPDLADAKRSSVCPTALTLSCTARSRVLASSGAAAAAHTAGKQREICSRRDTALVLFGSGGSAAGPKPGRASFSLELGCRRAATVTSEPV